MESRAIVREFLQRLKAASHAEDREVNIRSRAGLHQFVSRETRLSGRLDSQRIEQQRDQANLTQRIELLRFLRGLLELSKPQALDRCWPVTVNDLDLLGLEVAHGPALLVADNQIEHHFFRRGGNRCLSVLGNWSGRRLSAGRRCKHYGTYDPTGNAHWPPVYRLPPVHILDASLTGA